MRPSQLLAAVLSLSTLSAAWPEALGDIKAVENVHALLYGRQDAPESSEPPVTESPRTTSEARTSSDRRTTTEEESSRETSSESEENSESSTDTRSTPKMTGTVKPTATRINGGKKNQTSFADDLPAGGIQMITPGPFDGTQYYKVGDWVEFVWNYTSLSVTPTAIDVLATCSANQGTYTIAVNQTVEETGRVLWDTKAYKDSNKNPPLLTEMYTLIIYDAQSSITAMPRPGYLGTYSQHIFGMYLPKEYVPWDQFKCIGCNSALSAHDLSAMRILLFSGSTMLASFLFFSYNFGLW